jgi:hypothetical protein
LPARTGKRKHQPALCDGLHPRAALRHSEPDEVQAIVADFERRKGPREVFLYSNHTAQTVHQRYERLFVLY